MIDVKHYLYHRGSGKSNAHTHTHTHAAAVAAMMPRACLDWMLEYSFYY